MAKKKKKTRQNSPTQPPSINWAFDPDIPTHDFFERRDLDETWDLQEAVENFLSMMEGGDFRTWEAVLCQEQGVPLTERQEEALDDLMNFGDEEDDQILYINDIPRPSEPWYEILRKIAPHLLIEPFQTSDVHEEVKLDGWRRLVDCVETHAGGLSFPGDVTSPEEVVPAELRHKLWLQDCFNDLSGLGQSEELTLDDEEEPYRIGDFINHLRDRIESVEFLDLTLETLMTRVILPERDQPIFARLMLEELEMSSPQDRIALHLRNQP